MSYVIGVPEARPYRKVLDSDATRFGGSGYEPAGAARRREHAVTAIRIEAAKSTCRRSPRCSSNRTASARRAAATFRDSGLTVPALGFGAMQVGDPQLDERHVARTLNHVLDSGMTLIDTARSYGLAEERIGRHISIGAERTVDESRL